MWPASAVYRWTGPRGVYDGVRNIFFGGQVMDFNRLDLFVWLALWSLSLWLNTSMHPLKNPGVLRNCQDLYLIFLLVWCTVNFEPVYVKVNSSFAEGLLGRYRFAHSQREMSKQSGNRCNYKLWIYTGITSGLWKRFDLQKILYSLTFPWITPSSSLLRFTNVLIDCPWDW